MRKATAVKFATIGWIVGGMWIGLAAVLAVPLALALLLNEPWQPFALAVSAALLLGGLLQLRTRGAERSLGHREAMVTVTVVWVSICAFGAIPFAAYPEPQISLVDSLFESVSGFTTTGATVLSGLDWLPSSLLLWRSLTQWLGGMGIVIFGVAVLPILGVGGMGLFKAEAPGPTKDKMTPRIAETAKLLWVLYLGITVSACGLFYLYGMTPFDAVNHAMTAVATAGFSTHDQSLGYYDSGPIHFVATLTMLAGGTSFAILHQILTGGRSWLDRPELRAYIGIFCLATAVISADLLVHRSTSFPHLLMALEHAAFQAASILTTTGYTTADFDRWPGFSQGVLLALFFVGGMAGSTSGGLKVIRVILLARVVLMQFSRLAHPRAVAVMRLGPRTIDDEVLASSLGFIAMWLLLLAVGTIILAAGGTDLTTSLTAAAASLGNIGPAFGAAGPSHTYAPFSTGSKLVMATLMILGRLEIYTVLIVLTRRFWRD